MIERVPLADDYARPAERAWRGTDWSAYERDTVIAGRRLHYLEAGGGDRAFVLGHGMGGRWQHWLETIPAIVDQADLLQSGCVAPVDVRRHLHDRRDGHDAGTTDAGHP